MIKRRSSLTNSRWFRLFAAMSALALLVGCGPLGWGGTGSDKSQETKQPEEISRYTGEPSELLPFVYTTGKELSLTFDGMADDQTMEQLLDELDRYSLKATFFVPGMRVAEEPDLAQEIVSHGDEIENNTLDGEDLNGLSYEQIYREIHLGDEVIEQKTGAVPHFVRTKTGAANDDVRLAAAQDGMLAVVQASLFLHNWQGETEEEKFAYIRKHITRGGILEIDLNEFKSLTEVIPMIAEAAKEVGYRFVLLDDLAKQGGERKPLEQIPGYDAIRLNSEYRNAKYNLIYRKETNRKEVALTFDDWGTDYTITRILDILEKYGVKATFFLRADGVENNPNLARAIVDAGQEAANHTYSHQVLTTMTDAQMQRDVLKAYQVITEAIQEQPTMLFRPPTGEIDAHSAQVIAAMGYKNIAQYDVDSSDYLKSHSAKEIENEVLQQVKPGSVILMHMLDNIHTEEALPTVIEQLRKQGYTIETMSELIGTEG